MLEVEVIGAELAPGVPTEERIRRLCLLATASAGVEQGHLAIEFVRADRIALLNGQHRGKEEPTDVLSFPMDGLEGAAQAGVPVELGDVVICPKLTADLCEAIVHGVLHLLGMDHERDDGEMLALQGELLGWEAGL